MENWKDIKNEKGYQVSDLGRIRSLLRKTPKILTINYARKYGVVCLHNRRTEYVHILVANAFLDNPNNYPTVDHIDRNLKNNTITNLRFADYQMQKDNSNKAFGERIGAAKLKDAEVYQIKELLKTGIKQKSIAEKFNTSPQMITRIKKGFNWSHIK